MEASINNPLPGNVDGTTSSGGPVNNGTQQGTTEFSAINPGANGGVDTSARDREIDIDLEDNSVDSIRDFLAKPVAIWIGQVSTSDTEDQELVSADILGSLLSQPLWMDKLKGFLNMRATAKLRLTLNATPFQAGLLRMMYFPNHSVRPSEANSHYYNIVTSSQLPGVFLPFSQDAVELSVPYMSPTYYVQLDRVGLDAVSWGTVKVKVYCPMRTGSSGPTTAPCTLWLSFEDVDLAGQLYPQAKGNVSDRETNGGRGTISTIMASGRDYVRLLGRVPSMANLAEPTAWALDIASKAASALGWSKPTLSNDPAMMAVGGNWRSVNVDGGDMCAPLSFRSDNKVKTITDGHTGCADELSFDYVNSRWGALRLFDWDGSAITGSLLQYVDVGPTQFAQHSTVGTRDVITIPPCALGREFFSLYRGSFDINFKLVKTGYHSGALAFCWVPGTSAGTPTYAQTAFGYREIVSIQGGEDFCFRLPFLISQDYIECTDKIGRLCVFVVNPLVAPETCNPSIRVYVEVRGGIDLEYANPKQIERSPYIPQSKSGSEGADRPVVDFTLSEVEGRNWFVPIYGEAVLCVEDGCDHQHALHLLEAASASDVRCEGATLEGEGTMLVLADGVCLYIPPGISEESSERIQLHALSANDYSAQAISVEEDGERVCVTLGAATVQPRKTTYAERAIGEQILSFREIMKSEYFFSRVGDLTSYPFAVDTHQLCAFKWIGPNWYCPTLVGDHISMIASVYAFMRGGIRWRVNRVVTTPHSSMRSCLVPSWAMLPGSFVPIVSGALLSALNSGTNWERECYRIFQTAGVNESAFVQAPFYSKYRWAMTNFRVDESRVMKPFMPNNSLCMFSSCLTDTFSLSRSVSDDFDMGFFVGVPPLVVSNGPMTP